MSTDMGKIMGTVLMLSGVVLMSIGLLCALLLDNKSPDNKSPDNKPLEKWSVVCNEAGTFSFVQGDGNVSGLDYATYAETVKVAEKAKEWWAAYNHKKYEQERINRNKSFKPCNP